MGGGSLWEFRPQSAAELWQLRAAIMKEQLSSATSPIKKFMRLSWLLFAIIFICWVDSTRTKVLHMLLLELYHFNWQSAHEPQGSNKFLCLVFLINKRSISKEEMHSFNFLLITLVGEIHNIYCIVELKTSYQVTFFDRFVKNKQYCAFSNSFFWFLHQLAEHF